MDTREVMVAINRMKADGVVDTHAIGGAVGATFYLEPVATLGVDVFAALHPAPGPRVVSPKPVLDHLTARGHKAEGGYVVIAGWPVQVLPPTGPFAEEALAQAVEKQAAGIPVRVFAAEHLAA